MAKGKPKSNRKPSNKKGRLRDVNTKFEGKSISRDEDVREDVRNRQENDPAWYGVSKQMVNDAARISFNNPAGLKVPVWDLSTWGVQNTDAFTNRAVPGIMAFDYIYGPGLSGDNSSAVNLAAKNLYAYVRHVNSGHSNYEPADLMMYLNAVLSGYVMYAWLVRAYGVTLTYKQSNRYYNKALLEAMGFDAADVERHLPQFRFAINKLVRKLGTLPLPLNLNVIKRQTWLPSQLIEDTNSAKAQLYLFNPAGFYTYEETSIDPDTGLAIPGYLKWRTRTDVDLVGSVHTIWTVQDIEHATEYLCDKLRSSEDIGIISGDIIKAYGSNVFQLSEIDESFRVEPYCSDEVLHQIHNITIIGQCTNLDITQTTGTNGGAVIWMPQMNNYAASSHAYDKVYKAFFDNMRILSMHMDNPSPDDVMVATRLMSIDTLGTGNPKIGTEAVISGKVYQLINGNTNFVSFDSTISTSITPGTIALISAFDWYPVIYKYDCSGTYASPTLTAANVFAELDNYTYIDGETLSKMHEAAVLSLWDVPETAFYKAP